MSEHGTFTTLVTCMDGRIQKTANNWVLKKFETDFADVITEPGPDGILAENSDQAIINNIKKRLEVSIKGHGSQSITIVGHEDCAGNPVGKDQHLEDITKSVKLIKNWYPNLKVIGIWLEKITDKDWEIHELEKILINA